MLLWVLIWLIVYLSKSIFIDIKLGQRIFGQIEFEDDYIDICLEHHLKTNLLYQVQICPIYLEILN